jgi:hypothetical protein
MIGQPEALRLADALESDQQGIDLGAEGMGWGPSKTIRTQSASELRRLHEVNRELLQALKDADALISQLMPGVKHIALQDYGFLNTTLINNTKAIAKATGESK